MSLLVRTTLGVNWTLSMISRAGSATLVTGIDTLPLASVIAPAGAPDDGGGVGVESPCPGLALTRSRSSW